MLRPDPFKLRERDPKCVSEDVIDGLVCIDQAREVYAVALNSDTLEIDATDTERLRAAAPAN